MTWQPDTGRDVRQSQQSFRATWEEVLCALNVRPIVSVKLVTETVYEKKQLEMASRCHRLDVNASQLPWFESNVDVGFGE